jgi:hypothetical protein
MESIMKENYTPSFGERDQLRRQGWRFVDGKTSSDGRGYYSAHPNGGYYEDLIEVPFCYQMVKGCPAYHGTVAIMENILCL